MTDKIQLTQVSRALRDLTGRTAPTSRQLWHAIADGKIPSEVVNGRHLVRRADLPIIAAAMGLTVPAEQPKRRQSRAAEIAA